MKQFHAERAVVKEVINIEKFLLRHSAYIKPTNNSRHQPRKKSADKNCSPFYGIRPHTLRMKSFIIILLDLTPKELKKKKKKKHLSLIFFFSPKNIYHTQNTIPILHARTERLVKPVYPRAQTN